MRGLGKWLVVCVLLTVLFAASCGSDRQVPNPYGALQTPGPPPPARPGAQVWAVGTPLLVVTSANGGATWTTSHRVTTDNPFSEVLFGVTFADARHGWAVGRAGVVLATTDGGSQWTMQHVATNAVCLLQAAATDARHAWAVGLAGNGASGLILATTDGGSTWQAQYDGPDVLSAVAFSDARHGWAVGSKAILVTADGGAHWCVQRPVASRYHLKAVAFSDARHGWAVGGMGNADRKPGFIMATSDGGKHWTTKLSQTLDCLNGVSFVDARHGWVVGNWGVLYRTTDGGATWTLIHLNPYWGLGAVSFGDTRHGWAVVHPESAPSGDTAHGWGVLHQLALLATSDGGTTWVPVRTAQGPAGPVIITDVTCRETPGSH